MSGHDILRSRFFSLWPSSDATGFVHEWSQTGRRHAFWFTDERGQCLPPALTVGHGQD